MILVVFYFLLRVGEYTKPKTSIQNGKRVGATRTKQFVVGNVGFLRNGVLMPRKSPLDVPLTEDLDVLKFSNKKNGRMGQTITQHTTGRKMCPVHALSHIVYDILTDGGYEYTLICDVAKYGDYIPVESCHIIAAVRATTKILELELQAIDLDLVRAHSLRAEGAMPLTLHGYDDNTIMKMGRWKSIKFWQYIHNQIAHLSKDISQKMSMALPFFNLSTI